MEEGDLAADKSTAAALGGWIVFEDECGQSMRPPRSRTWGRRGITRSSGSAAAAPGTSRLPGWPAGFGHLVQVIRHGLKKIQYHPRLIEGCLAGTGLALDQTEHPTDTTN